MRNDGQSLYRGNDSVNAVLVPDLSPKRANQAVTLRREVIELANAFVARTAHKRSKLLVVEEFLHSPRD
jgi:hypothetical protein